MEAAEKEKGADGVRSVERALEILLAFGDSDRDLSVGELLKRVDLSRPTLYRLLYTLQQNGFVLAEGDPQRFRLGPAVGRLAWAWSASLDVAALAQPVLRTIWEETGETVALFIPQGATRICVAELPSTQPLSFRRGIGYSERIVRGASGRALLAWMDPTPEQLAQYCEGLDFEPKDLVRKLQSVRKLGYAVSRNELINGAVAIAVPFFDHSNRVAGSIGVFGPSVRLEQDEIERIAERLLEHAQSLSGLLGNHPPNAIKKAANS
ncbi:IclR family transcriptional regulator [Burkholderia cenocepacia]|uniref:IclR family transcriptional regulator n=1 Tax=Burkholderia cenocepacia TaxID=95486 RepID=UPI002863EB77|nr:IclR family transcriptional regulator [Burkholderia cenocepacia]MDR8071888.1 IclR family transcriptional regulator [Burkholderia cenocepacia]